MRLISLLAAMLISLAGSAAIAQTQQTITYTYYPVRPEVGTSIYKQMFKDSTVTHQDRKVVAISDWNIKYTVSYRTLKDGLCEIETHEVVSTCDITLPRLVTDEKRLIDAFNEYMPYLRKHEHHHCQIAMDYADYLDNQLKSLGPMECQALKAAVKATRNTAIIEAKKAHQLFDRQTVENRKKFHAGTHFLADLFPENP